MLKVDAKQEIDGIFAGCDDVIHIIGTFDMELGGKLERVAMARLILEDRPTRPWPEELIYRQALEAGSGVEMFVICPPTDFLNPMVVAEWDEQYTDFIKAAEKHGVFVVEAITPSKKRAAVYMDGKKLSDMEQPLTQEQFERIRDHGNGTRVTNAPGGAT